MVAVGSSSELWLIGCCRFKLVASSTAVSSAVSIKKCLDLAWTWLKYDVVTHIFQRWLVKAVKPDFDSWPNNSMTCIMFITVAHGPVPIKHCKSAKSPWHHNFKCLFWSLSFCICLFLDAITSSSTYPCQWVGQSVIVSDFGDSYRIYRACKLVSLSLCMFFYLFVFLSWHHIRYRASIRGAMAAKN